MPQKEQWQAFDRRARRRPRLGHSAAVFVDAALLESTTLKPPPYAKVRRGQAPW